MPSSNKCPMARRRNGAIFSAFAVLVVALLCAGVTAGVHHVSLPDNPNKSRMSP